MKIGIIGINRYAKFLNFACDLHVYAFQRFLAQNGYESTILNYKPAYFGKFDMRHPAASAEARYRLAVQRNEPRAELEKFAEIALGYRSAIVERERRYDKFEMFIDKHLSFTAEVYDSDLLEIEDPEFDCYICVTDVIWQSIPKHVFDRGFLLGSKAFEGKQKIAYAASRGASRDFPEDVAQKFFEYLDDIDTISVREEDFSQYIEKNSELSAPTVLDPVLLHDHAFWDQVTTKPREERFILLYYVMEGASDTIDKAVEYAKLHDLTVVELSDRPLKFGRITDPDVKHVPRYDVGMEEWLGYIKHAEAVFTNSFHGCCFGMLFERRLFVGSRNGQKVPNFLATFGLTDRQFAKKTPASALPGDIDYTKAKQILETKRAESGAFILDALARAEGRVAAGEPVDLTEFDERRKSLTYPVLFHSGGVQAQAIPGDKAASDPIQLKKLAKHSVEYKRPGVRYVNDGSAQIPARRFDAEGLDFAGWTLRFRIDNRWFWYLADGVVVPGDEAGVELDDRKAVFADGDALPHLPVNRVSVVVLVARWKAATALPAQEPAPSQTSSGAPRPPVSGTKKLRTVRRIRRRLGKLLRRWGLR